MQGGSAEGGRFDGNEHGWWSSRSRHPDVSSSHQSAADGSKQVRRTSDVHAESQRDRRSAQPVPGSERG